MKRKVSRFTRRDKLMLIMALLGILGFVMQHLMGR